MKDFDAMWRKCSESDDNTNACPVCGYGHFDQDAYVEMAWGGRLWWVCNDCVGEFAMRGLTLARGCNR